MRYSGLRLPEPHQHKTELHLRSIVIAVECQGRLQLGACFGQSAFHSPEHTQSIMRQWAVRIAHESFGEQLFGARFVALHRGAPPIDESVDQGHRQANLCIDGSWVERRRLLESLLSLPIIRARGRPIKLRPTAHDEIASIRIDFSFLLDTAADIPHQFKVKGPRKTAGDLALGFSQVPPVRLEPVCPNMRAAFGIDELHVDLDLVAGPACAAFDDITDTEFAADLLYVGGFALIGEGSIAGDHKAAGNWRQIRRQIISDTVGEVFLVRVPQQVLKGQYYKRQARCWVIGRGCCDLPGRLRDCRSWRSSFWPDPPGHQ